MKNSDAVIIHSDDFTTRLRLVLEFSSFWIVAIIIRSLKNVCTNLQCCDSLLYFFKYYSLPINYVANFKDTL
jgi:hypothetical protein